MMSTKLEPNPDSKERDEKLHYFTDHLSPSDKLDIVIEAKDDPELQTILKAMGRYIYGPWFDEALAIRAS